MDSTEITARAEAFRKSISAGRITLAKVEKALAGWVSAGMCSQKDVDAILAIVRA